MTQELVYALRERRVILFVGAGVSRNLGLPSFNELINHLAEELGVDPELFALYGDYLALAEYYRLQKGSLGPLRSWLDIKWHTGVDVSKSRVHELIVKLGCPIVYTTNYDRWLEKAHEHYCVKCDKVLNVADIARVREGVVQIVKFHGDFDDDESIVLTESSYFDRLSFESPLDVKLRADALGRSILFLGYSLTDINLRYLLYKIHRQWEQSAWASVRPKSYVFLTRPNPVQEAILAKRGIIPVVSEKDDPGLGMQEFLDRLVQEAFAVV